MYSEISIANVTCCLNTFEIDVFRLITRRVQLRRKSFSLHVRGGCGTVCDRGNVAAEAALPVLRGRRLLRVVHDHGAVAHVAAGRGGERARGQRGQQEEARRAGLAEVARGPRRAG